MGCSYDELEQDFLLGLAARRRAIEEAKAALPAEPILHPHPLEPPPEVKAAEEAKAAAEDE